jgi:hypothetical protein
MEFPTREVKQIGVNLLAVNEYSGTGKLLYNLAEQAEKGGHNNIKTDNTCAISAVRTARKSMTNCIAMYAH